MADPRLEDVADLVQRALRDSRVFRREPPGAELLTVERYDVGAHTYVALLGGGANATHPALRGNSNRSHGLREFPLRLRSDSGDAGSAQVCMVLRPVSDAEAAGPAEHVARFAPAERLPWVAVREFHLRLVGLADNELRIRNLRVELDPRPAADPAQERWLRSWQKTLGVNPAHPPWHVHVNSGDGVAPGERPEFSDDDLRLAIGAPNPLVLVLSFAAWYQRVLLQGYGRR